MILHFIITVAIVTIVLIASLLFLNYVNKNQLSKWYRYAAIAILIHSFIMILWTIGAGAHMHHMQRMGMGGCEMGGGPRMNMMYMHEGGGCHEGMMQGCGEEHMGCGMGMRGHHGHGRMEMNCCQQREERGSYCEMDRSEGNCEIMEKAECEKKCEKDTIIKKEVIIKKK